MEKFKQNRYLNWESDSNNALVARLERNQRNLMQLRGQLSSYRSEPTTYSLYERLDQLRRAMDRCSKNNKDIITGLKSDQIPMSGYIVEAKKQLNAFREIHKNVESYLINCAEGESEE